MNEEQIELIKKTHDLAVTLEEYFIAMTPLMPLDEYRRRSDGAFAELVQNQQKYGGRASEDFLIAIIISTRSQMQSIDRLVDLVEDDDPMAKNFLAMLMSRSALLRMASERLLNMVA